MTTYKFKINGVTVKYTHESLAQAYREARADYPEATIKKED